MTNSTELSLGQAPAYLTTIGTQQSSVFALDMPVSAAPVNTLSIQGKQFTLKKATGDIFDAGSTINVVLLRANPRNSKVLFEGEYTGEDQKPVCSSSNGMTPDAHIENPKHSNCAQCPFNALGSKGNGTNAKACGDKKYVAVLPECDPSTPYLLQLPVTSIINLKNYLAELQKYNIGAEYIVTQLSFQQRDEKGKVIAYPRVFFKTQHYIPAELVELVRHMQNNEEVLRMIKILKEEDTPAIAAPTQNVLGAVNAEPEVTFAAQPKVEANKVIETPVVKKAPAKTMVVEDEKAATAPKKAKAMSSIEEELAMAEAELSKLLEEKSSDDFAI